jgi:hypothetical protein
MACGLATLENFRLRCTEAVNGGLECVKSVLSGPIPVDIGPVYIMAETAAVRGTNPKVSMR